LPESDRAARVARLSAAAATRRANAEARARRAITKLESSGEQVNFVAVARIGGVSTSFLYQHDQLRGAIESRRVAGRPVRRPVAESSSTASLRTKLQVAVERNRELAEEICGLRTENEALRSRLLELDHHYQTPARESPAAVSG
jgi:Family of unknown function (DUF6262)